MDNRLLKVSDEQLEVIISNLPIPKSSKDSLRAYLLMTKELSKESDRGMALFATAHLDYKLKKLLCDKLIGSKGHLKEIFSLNGPVGTFSARIKLAYSIGLLSKDVMDDINILRKIRNDFAHSNKVINFETEKIKNRCNSLKLNVKNEEESTRSIFLNVVSAISGHIEVALIGKQKFIELKGQNLEERKVDFNKLMDSL